VSAALAYPIPTGHETKLRDKFIVLVTRNNWSYFVAKYWHKINCNFTRRWHEVRTDHVQMQLHLGLPVCWPQCSPVLHWRGELWKHILSRV
jgi:hypothetical protein